MENKVKLICITPIKNESWILEKFLTVTSLWADHIILADQNSSDNSVEIAASFEKAIVIKNENNYNEFERTKILLAEARKISGKKIIFALDADEIFTANFSDSPEWNTILNAKEGTILLFDRINLTPDFENYFGSLKMVLGLVDDGISCIENTSNAIIHNIRLPWPINATSIYLKDIKVLHYDYVIPERTLSKIRWYQCFEKVQFKKSDEYLLKKYKTFNKIEDYLIKIQPSPTKKKWFKNYSKNKIDITSLNEPFLWWDNEVMKMIEENGIDKFKRLDIHTINWEAIAQKNGIKNASKFKLRRTILDKIILRYWKHFLI